MKQFTDYLRARNYQPHTIRGMIRAVREYRAWIKAKETTVYRASHSTAIEYLEHLRSKHLKTGTINQKLGFLRHYYNSLAHSRNPFTDIRLKGATRRVHVNLFSEEELQELYMTLPEETSDQRRNKILAGLYISFRE